jgi:hypothetical protein
MKTTHGNSLCSYRYLKLGKCHVSCFILYVFSSTILENRKTELVLWGGGGVGTGGMGEVAGKGVGG